MMISSRDTASHLNSLPGTLAMGPVALRSRDPERLVPFYEQAVGLQVLDRREGSLVLGAGTRPLVELIGDQGAMPVGTRAPGLFHLAVRVPDRRALAQRIVALHTAGVRFGASDHLVSEALYIDDPDGNGVEIYCDRDRASWSWEGGRIAMATLPLDLASFASLAPSLPGPAPEGTDMGHVHLKVRDLAEAEAFWVRTLGFDLMTTYPGALFVAAGGYHHHLGLNVWASRGAPVPMPGRIGLDHFTIVVPHEAIAMISARLMESGYPFAVDEGRVRVADPSGNAVWFQTA